MKVEYVELQEGAKNLQKVIEQMRHQNQELYNQVNSLFDTWEGKAKPQYESDYQRVSHNVDQTLEVADALSQAVFQYAQEIEAVETSHSSSKIQ